MASLSIGEVDDVRKRLSIHLRSADKDFFDRLAFAVSSDDSFTKGHIRTLRAG